MLARLLFPGLIALAFSAQAQPAFYESEPNDTPAQANAIGGAVTAAHRPSFVSPGMSSWTITKTADPTAHIGFAGDMFTSDYDVVVDQTITDYGFKVWGTMLEGRVQPVRGAMPKAAPDLKGQAPARGLSRPDGVEVSSAVILHHAGLLSHFHADDHGALE